MNMKKIIGLVVCLMMLVSGFAMADQTVELLPGLGYVVDLPDDMEYVSPEASENGVETYFNNDLEMDCFCYPKSEAENLGMAETLKETVNVLKEKRWEAELRKVNRITMVCVRMKDESDGAPGIGYIFEDGDLMIEIDFWYATQEAADRTVQIMSSIRQE